MGFLFATVLPPYLYLRPIAHELAIFPATPELVIGAQCEVLRKYLIEVNLSTINFFRNEHCLPTPVEQTCVARRQSRTRDTYSTKTKTMLSNFGLQFEPSPFAAESKQIVQLQLGYDKLGPNTTEFL